MMGLRLTDAEFRRALAGGFLLVWLALAIDPVDRAVWALENLLVVVLVGLLWFYRREAPLSRTSSVLVVLFLGAHELGAHYTYAQVPYDAWLQALTGLSFHDQLGVERNQFDRLMHLLFGLLGTVPIREVLLRTSPIRRGWSYVLPVALSMAASSGYELIEWLAAVGLGGESGADFVGAQGDVWDAQKDMALACLGAVAAMLLTAWRERGAARDLIGARTVGDDHLAGARLQLR